MMAALISNDIIDAIREKVDIVDVISSYVPLKKAGGNFKANCPFHHEKTPSFNVNPARQIFHCFGCHVGGNAFNFVMRYERVTFPEAVEILGKRAGISVVRAHDGDRETRKGENERYLAFHQLALERYCRSLKDRQLGAAAEKYLSSRGFDEAITEEFHLGYAPDSWDFLMRAGKEAGYTEKEMIASGLILQNQGGKVYDRFRGRIMFPIYDARERIVAFGARSIGDAMPKYMNSPESALYNKSKILYGLHLTRKHIIDADCALLLEGYVDLISLYQSGIKNVAAVLGTALTQDHARLIKRYTGNVIMIFDSDAAGINAMLRSSEIMIAEALNVQVAVLPKGHDPDTYIKAFGDKKFKQLLDGALSIYAFRLHQATLKFGTGNPESKAKVVDQMIPFLKLITNEVLRATYIKNLSEELEINEEALRAEIKKTKGSHLRPDLSRHSDGGDNSAAPIERVPEAELLILGLLIDEPSLIVQVKDILSPDYFSDRRILKCLNHIFDLKEPLAVKASKIISDLEDAASGEVIPRALSAAEKVDDKDKALIDCIIHLKKTWIKKERKILEDRLKDLEKRGMMDESLDIVSKISEYDRLIRNLNHEKIAK